MKCKASYHSRLGADGLQTVGVMVVGGDSLVYKALTGLTGLQAEMDQVLSFALGMGHSAKGVFDFTVASGNGYTNDWSVPFAVEGDDAQSVASHLVVKLESGA